MELTIVLSVSPDSKNEEIFETLDSLPWDSDGVDLVVYSEDTDQVRKVIKNEDLESTLLNGQMNVLFCDEPYSSDDTYMNIGVEDCKTELITFIKPGDTIDNFDPDLLNEKIDVGFGSTTGDESIASICYDSRMTPLSTCGIVYSVDFLRRNYLKLGKDFIPSLMNILIADLEAPEYTDGWGKYSIDELFTVSPGNQTPLQDEYELPETYTELWKNHELDYNYYLRDLLWNRMSRASALVITSYPTKQNVISKFYKYLLPDNKASILC